MLTQKELLDFLLTHLPLLYSETILNILPYNGSEANNAAANKRLLQMWGRGRERGGV